MNKHLSYSIKSIFSTIRNSFLPALFFAAALVMFFAFYPFEKSSNVTLHILFMCFSFLGLSFLYVANQSKPFFSLLLGTICYLLINYLKRELGNDYVSSPEYICLCFALPFDFAAFYFLPQSKIRSRYCKYILLILMAQIMLIQHAGNIVLSIPYINLAWEAMPLWAVVFWLILFAPIAIDVSLRNTIINTGLFYADSSLLMGLIYSNQPSGLSCFFACFALILFIVTLIDLYHRYHYDYLSGVGSYNSYLSKANSKFPFKYTIGLFCIDNRDKLLKVIGRNKMQILEQMMIDKIKSFPYGIELYRYNESELIMVFKNEDARHTREFADNIRHVVAASEFLFRDKKNLKITISVCVSEKTRKDLNATEVTERAHNSLQKAYRFNCNITTVAAS